MDHTVPMRFSGYAGMHIGRDNGLPVDRVYADRSPFAFTGTIRKVVFDLRPHPSEDDMRRIHEHMHQGALAHGMSA
jgi:arylsulfatase